MERRIEAIIFDLGGVLIDFDHTVAARRISQFSDKTAEEIFALFFDSALVVNFEEGKIGPEDFFKKIKETINLRIDYEVFLPIWNEIFFQTEGNKEVLELARCLKGRYEICVLSNVNTLHFNYIRDNFRIFDVFPRVIASCELGMRKPHPLIYRRALEELGVRDAAGVFYTDDRAELVEAAALIGIKARVFKNAPQLKKDLFNLGVTIQQDG